MKTSEELIHGTVRNQQARARTIAGVAAREAMLRAAGEVEALVVSLVAECDECPIGDAVMSWVKATREAAEGES